MVMLPGPAFGKEIGGVEPVAVRISEQQPERPCSEP